MILMRLRLFFKLVVLSLCLSLLAFGLLSVTFLEAAKFMAICTVLSVAITAFYPDIRGVKQGDLVSVVADAGIPSLIGRFGTAVSNGRKNDRIRILLQNGTEVLGVIENYQGLISPPRIRLLYEERLVE